MSPALYDLIDDLREQDTDAAAALAQSLLVLMREIGMQRDRIAVAVACSDACHELSRLILSIESATDTEAQARFRERTTAKERAEMAIADLSC